MSTSGRIDGTAIASGVAVPGRYAYWIDWTRNSYSIENDSSNITLYMRIQRIDGAYEGAWALDVKPSVSLSVGGAAKTPSISYIDTRNKVICTFATWTGDVKHNPDGTPNCPVVASFTHYGSTSLSGGTLSGSADLDTIPQASSLDYLACATNYFTGTMTYRYTPKASTLYNRCNISLNLNGTFHSVKSVLLGKKTAAQQTATVALSGSELKTIYDLLPATTKGVLRFTFRTYSDAEYNNQVGDYVYKELELNIPDEADTKPTVGMSLITVSSLPAAFDGLYIQGKTKVKATLDTYGKYNAIIRSHSVVVEGKTYSGYASDKVYTSDYLTQYGSVDIYGYATDARGFTGSASQKINVIAYGKPRILDVTAVRCDENGNPSDSGTCLKIHAKRSYSPVKNGSTQKNFCAIRYRWKTGQDSFGDNWTTILDRSASGDEVTTGALLKGQLDKETTYQVQVQAIDDIGEHAETTITVPTEKVHMHRTKNAMALGKYVEGENIFDVAWDAHFRGEVLIGDTGMTLREYILSVISEGG